MKAKIARRSPETTSNPLTKARRPRRGAVNPTKAVKALRSVVAADRVDSVLTLKDTRSHLTQPTPFLSHSLQLRPQNLGRAGR